MADPLVRLVGSVFGLLTHARRRKIDLGAAGQNVLHALECVTPGIMARLDAQCPVGDLVGFKRQKRSRKFAGNPEGKPTRVPKVNPIKRKVVRVRELDGVA